MTDYGALCDGVTDDRLAIQAAIDAAAVDGGRVLFPAGTCGSGGEIKLYNLSGVYLEGKGRGVSIIQKLSGTYSGWNSIIKFLGSQDSGVRELTIDGNRTQATGGTQMGINVTTSTGVRLSNLELVEHFKYGIYAGGSTATRVERLTISDVRFLGISSTAIYLGKYWNDILIDGNTFEAVDGRTFYYYAGGASTVQERLILTRNSFREAPGGEAIFISWGGLVDSVISNNVLDGGGIVSYSLGRSTISNNRISNAGIGFRSGIGRPVTVANNTIQSLSYGITASGTSNTADDAIQVTIIGNRILSDYGGVSISAGKNVAIVGNSIAPVTVALGGSHGRGVKVAGLKVMEGLLIANNQIDEMKWGIRVGPYSTSTRDVDTVLVTGNVIRSSVANAGGVLISATPNGKGAMTTNYQVEGNLEVFTTP